MSTATLLTSRCVERARFEGLEDKGWCGCWVNSHTSFLNFTYFIPHSHNLLCTFSKHSIFSKPKAASPPYFPNRSKPAHPKSEAVPNSQAQGQTIQTLKAHLAPQPQPKAVPASEAKYASRPNSTSTRILRFRVIFVLPDPAQ